MSQQSAPMSHHRGVSVGIAAGIKLCGLLNRRATLSARRVHVAGSTERRSFCHRLSALP
jgi:hypothetical protein